MRDNLIAMRLDERTQGAMTWLALAVALDSRYQSVRLSCEDRRSIERPYNKLSFLKPMRLTTRKIQIKLERNINVDVSLHTRPTLWQ